METRGKVVRSRQENLHCITGGISFDIVRHQYRWLETEAGKEMEQERGLAMECHYFTDSMVHLMYAAGMGSSPDTKILRQLLH